MAPVIWGLNLGDMRWSAFKGSNMFRKDYHLRRAKMIVYQIAMVFCVISESVGTDALTIYNKQQQYISMVDPNAYAHNDDFIGIASFNIFLGVYVATIFGAAFFFDLFWPERYESKGVRLAWKICALLACLMGLGDALAYTVIVALHQVTISGVDAATAQTIMQTLTAADARNPTLIYRHNALAITSIVFLWLGWVATVASTVILFKSIAHDDEFGPKSAHTVRDEEEKAGTTGRKMSSSETVAGPTRYSGPDRSGDPYANRQAPNFMADDAPRTSMSAQDTIHAQHPV